MTVTPLEYDSSVTGMRDNTVPAGASELQDTGAVVPVVGLPAEAAWVRDLTPGDLAAMVADWRMLVLDQPDPDRPALVRLDLLFPDRRRLAVLWEIRQSRDFGSLAVIELADAVVFRADGAADLGVMVTELGLGELDDFAQLAFQTRSNTLARVLRDYLEQRGRPPR
ncbi:hypothetical protein Q5424_04990 [Conexibacter sp. JD483]|uniref:hypothetical protein n=1 Tax=unclassified Conexibacter TaxID=2627773 RepID=UPI00271E4FE2|nr:MULTISPECIES: hypothetical protein [unclassified Conexibacter]MDO8184689.1 hypothetical protein [Conexibacter sp. CPCC 205706]MDO8197995.1 hypothetical protein [Conexibacter sp. CPCC 205762]MDR9368425.1 hypothetical protein [Conexibacter sp. JD483]